MTTQLAFLPDATPRLQYLPLREQPAHRVAEAPTTVNLVELLAALIGGPRQVETAEALLKQYKTLHAIRQARAADLARSVHGLGRPTAARLVAALELARRATLESADERPSIHSVADAAALVMYEMAALEQEELRAILLDTRMRLMSVEFIYRASINQAQVRVAEVFKTAVRRNAVNLIAVHNHPSGDPTPSPDDVAITRALVQAGKLLDVEVIDHLIIGQGRFVSMKERGLGFS
ncbi:MAG: DNA repair protein RadC [Anaerolineales bacterium]|nr:DNA repair protein RadC [Anaerolineales bacterium]